MKGLFFIVVLALYSAFPALLTAVLSVETGDINAFYAGISLFIFQAAAVFFLFRIERRRSVFLSAAIVFVIVIFLSVFYGIFIHWSFYRLLLNLYPGPVLAVCYSLIHRFSRRQVFEQLSRGLNMIILLLLSYSVMLIILKIHHYLFTPEKPALEDLIIGVYESVNYLPALFFLMILRNSAESRLLVDSGEIVFRNENISPAFNDIQMLMLKLFFENKNLILRCRDASGAYGGFECAAGQGCKASHCPGYSVVYRNIAALSRKLENIGIGRIIPPENKRNVIKEGWRLSLFPNVTFDISDVEKPGKGLTAAFSAVSEKPHLSDIAAYGGQQPGGSLPSLFIALIGGFLFSAEFYFALTAGRSVTVTAGISLFVAVFIPEVFLLAAPLFAKTRRAFLRLIVSGSILLSLYPFFAAGQAGESSALFLALKNMALFSILFLLRYPLIERTMGIDRLRRAASGSLFWLIWFYMAALTVFRNPSFVSRELFTQMGYTDIVFMIFDRLLLVTLFVLSVFFYSLPGKSLELGSGVLLFDKKELPSGLSAANNALLIDFIAKENGVLFCDEILKKLHPAEAVTCSEDCKPSVCLNYQKIYKRIQAVRKYLETNGIGTIVSPERKPYYSKEQGWRFVLYEDVYIKRS